MRFKPGQEITPTKRSFDVVFGEMGSQNFPKFGKVYVVRGYPLAGTMHGGFLSLMEFDAKYVYNEISFEPVITDEQLADELQEVQLFCQKYKHGLIDG